VRIALATLSIPLLCLAAALGGDGDGNSQTKPKAPAAPIRKPNAAQALPQPGGVNEAEALAFVGEHHPELARVLETLKPMDPKEYRAAILELSQVARTMADLKTRNPKRYEVALDAWKTKSRVELIAAQLAGAPSEELRSQLRLAIEAKLDAEIRRHRFELEQAEAAAKKSRETLDRLETHRDALIESRFRALLPKKPSKAKRPADGKASVAPSNQPAKATSNPNGEDRR
jgi:hypothetical protein